MNTFEVIVTLTPNQLGCIECRHDHEEEHGAAFDSLQHQVSDWPDLNASNSACELAIIHGEYDQQADNGPEGDITNYEPNSEAAKGNVLSERCRPPEYLVNSGKTSGDQRADGSLFLDLSEASLGRTSALRPGRERLD